VAGLPGAISSVPDGMAAAVLAGIVLVAAGILRLGRYTRFVSYSVMIGFLTGVSVNIFCGQIAGQPALCGCPHPAGSAARPGRGPLARRRAAAPAPHLPGSDFIKVVGDYADQLAERGGRLYLTGLEPSLTERLVRTGHVEDGPVRTFEATPIVGEAPQRA
jgi:hypothetical protein